MSGVFLFFRLRYAYIFCVCNVISASQLEALGPFAEWPMPMAIATWASAVAPLEIYYNWNGLEPVGPWPEYLMQWILKAGSCCLGYCHCHSRDTLYLQVGSAGRHCQIG